MKYKKYKPSDLLSDFVECYFVWHSDNQPVSNLVVESPPNGRCSIVFNIGDDYYLQNRKYERLRIPRAFVSGQSIYSYKLFLDGVIFIAGIVLKPTALFSLFNLPTFQFTEERAPLNTVFNAAATERLTRQVQTTPEPDDIAKMLDEFVMQQFRLRGPMADAIDKAANTILEKNGMITVAELMQQVYMSRRNFERKFFTKVGLSPKYFARIARISYLMNLIAGKKEADWKSLLIDCAYYDQSHFIKDFIEFTGRTPQQYLEGNSELANFVEKPSPTKMTH